MYVIDTTMLLPFFRPQTPVSSAGGKTPISFPELRVKHLIDTIETEGANLLVPTPVLSEVLIKASPEQFTEILSTLGKHRVFEIVPFDQQAATELAVMMRPLITRQRKGRRPEESHAKLKFDMQVLAIARSRGAKVIFSDDEGVQARAKHFNMTPRGLAELDLPPSSLQVEAF